MTIGEPANDTQALLEAFAQDAPLTQSNAGQKGGDSMDFEPVKLAYTTARYYVALCKFFSEHDRRPILHTDQVEIYAQCIQKDREKNDQDITERGRPAIITALVNAGLIELTGNKSSKERPIYRVIMKPCWCPDRPGLLISEPFWNSIVERIQKPLPSVPVVQPVPERTVVMPTFDPDVLRERLATAKQQRDAYNLAIGPLNVRLQEISENISKIGGERDALERQIADLQERLKSYVGSLDGWLSNKSVVESELAALSRPSLNDDQIQKLEQALVAFDVVTMVIPDLK